MIKIFILLLCILSSTQARAFTGGTPLVDKNKPHSVIMCLKSTAQHPSNLLKIRNLLVNLHYGKSVYWEGLCFERTGLFEDEILIKGPDLAWQIPEWQLLKILNALEDSSRTERYTAEFARH